MNQNHFECKTVRRNFLTSITAGIAAMGISAIVSPFKLSASSKSNQTTDDLIKKDKNEAEAWFDKIKGRHKMVFDIAKPDGLFLTFTRNFLESNNETGTPDSDLSAVIVLRHAAIILALKDTVWEKYKLGEFFNVKDEAAGGFALHNTYWDPKRNDNFPSNKSIDHLQKRGVLFCVCDTALDNISEKIAQLRDVKKTTVKTDFYEGILPEIQLVPSGVWALGRAQEKGCPYCYGS